MIERTQRLTVDPNRDSVAAAVVEAVCDHRATDLSSDEWGLYDHVDPDALDALFAGVSPDMTLRIALENVAVSVWHDDGAVSVRLTERPA